jgi:hypothetical protein
VQMRTTTATGTALVLALSLAACGRSDVSPYCAALQQAQSEWTTSGASLANRQGATRLVSRVRTIEENAPDEVRGDWKTLLVFLEKFAVDRPDLTTLTAELESVQATARRVETHARATCGIDLTR